MDDGVWAYFTGKPCKNGHITYRYTKQAGCAKCINDWRSQYRKANFTEVTRKQRIAKRRWTKNNRLRVWYQAIKSNAKRRKIPFDLSFDDLPSATHCKACGIEFDTAEGRPASSSPTIDRVDNSCGYTKDNVAIICNRCNGLKRDSTVDDLRRLIAYIEANSPATIRAARACESEMSLAP